MEKVTKTEIFLLCLTALFVVFTLLLFLGSNDGGDSYTVVAEKEDAQQEPQHKGPLNINRATAEQLQSLEGIGPVLAQRIVDYRTTHGSFGSVEELLEIEGIGSGTLEQIRDFITTEEEP